MTTMAAPASSAAAPVVPLPAAAQRLLARADGELIAAELSTQPWEQYLHAHLAALRAAAAVLAVRGTPQGRGAPRDAWRLAGAVAPELNGWWSYFAAGAGVRAAVQAGRIDVVDVDLAVTARSCAQRTVDQVRDVLGIGFGLQAEAS